MTLRGITCLLDCATQALNPNSWTIWFWLCRMARFSVGSCPNSMCSCSHSTTAPTSLTSQSCNYAQAYHANEPARVQTGWPEEHRSVPHCSGDCSDSEQTSPAVTVPVWIHRAMGCRGRCTNSPVEEALMNAMYPLLCNPDEHVLSTLGSLVLALLEGRTDLPISGVFGAGKTRSAAILVVGLLVPQSHDPDQRKCCSTSLCGTY